MHPIPLPLFYPFYPVYPLCPVHLALIHYPPTPYPLSPIPSSTPLPRYPFTPLLPPYPYTELSDHSMNMLNAARRHRRIGRDSLIEPANQFIVIAVTHGSLKISDRSNEAIRLNR